MHHLCMMLCTEQVPLGTRARAVYLSQESMPLHKFLSGCAAAGAGERWRLGAAAGWECSASPRANHMDAATDGAAAWEPRLKRLVIGVHSAPMPFCTYDSGLLRYCFLSGVSTATVRLSTRFCMSKQQ